MSSKSNFLPYKKISAKKLKEREDKRDQKKADVNRTRSNHVSESDKSRGGQPFHFAGPKKEKI